VKEPELGFTTDDSGIFTLLSHHSSCASGSTRGRSVCNIPVCRSPVLDLCKLNLKCYRGFTALGEESQGYLPRGGRTGRGCWCRITIMLL